MRRYVAVGLLAAVGAAMSGLVAFVHGDLVSVVIADGAVATGLAAYLAVAPQKKCSRSPNSGIPALYSGRLASPWFGAEVSDLRQGLCVVS
jgi:hypothetical protein